MKQELINVSDLNQYAYCPRRYWYIHFYDTQGKNYERTEGKTKHENQSKRGGWLTELYIESEDIGLKGKIDVLELDGDKMIPIERKRAESGEYYKSDEMQLAGYCMLLEEHLNEPVHEGAIYLYETDQRMHVPITEDHRKSVKDQIEKMRSMSPDSPPSFADNPSKCEKCSCREYCMPEESKMLGET